MGVPGFPTGWRDAEVLEPDGPPMAQRRPQLGSLIVYGVESPGMAARPLFRVREDGGMCRIHGRRCSIPWGYDRDHTDSDRPYTLAELAVRAECPHFYAYPTPDDYLAGWNLWRALRRDDRLTGAEADARFQVVAERIMSADPRLSELRRTMLDAGLDLTWEIHLPPLAECADGET